MIRRKVEKFVVADDIANSCNGWTLSNTPHTAVAKNRFCPLLNVKIVHCRSHQFYAIAQMPVTLFFSGLINLAPALSELS